MSRIDACMTSFRDDWKVAVLSDPRNFSQIYALVNESDDVENLNHIRKLPDSGLPLILLLVYEPNREEIPVDKLIMPLSMIIVPIASRLQSLTISINPSWTGKWDLPLDGGLGLMPELAFLQLRVFNSTDYENTSTSSEDTSTVPTKYWDDHWKFIRLLEAPKLHALYLCGPGAVAGIPRLLAPEKLEGLSLTSPCDEDHEKCRDYLDAFTAALSCQNLKILTLEFDLGVIEPLILSSAFSEIFLPHLFELTLDVCGHPDTRNGILEKLRTPRLSNFTLGVHFDESLLAALEDFYDRSKFKLWKFHVKGDEDVWTADELMIFLDVAGDYIHTLTLDIPLPDDECIWIALTDEHALPCLEELRVTLSSPLEDFIDDLLREMLSVRWWRDEEADDHWTCERLKSLSVHCNGEEDVIDPGMASQWQKYREEGMDLDLQYFPLYFQGADSVRLTLNTK